MNLSRLWKKIGTHGIMVLSTCTENRVSSRPMSVIINDGKFYCQTDENYLKYRQICKNPSVALSINNFSIEGECTCIDRPIDENFFTMHIISILNAPLMHIQLCLQRYSLRYLLR